MVRIKDAVELLHGQVFEWIGAIHIDHKRRRMMWNGLGAARCGNAERIMASALLEGVHLDKACLAIENGEIGRVGKQAADGACIAVKLIFEAHARMRLAEPILPGAQQRKDVVLATMAMTPDADGIRRLRWILTQPGGRNPKDRGENSCSFQLRA